MASDDFSGQNLDSEWLLPGPTGTSASLGVDGDEKYLELTTSSGDHNAYDANNTARAMRQIADTDFEYDAKFLTQPTEKYEMQGILVEQDANNWIRFDTYSDGTRLWAYAAVTVNGNTSQVIKVQVPTGSAPYLRVNRTGDVWTFSYSTDGATWVTAGSFTYAMTVSAIGVFAGSTSSANGYTAQVDYLQDNSDPILQEDGVTASNTPPTAVDDAATTLQDQAVTIDLLDNDSDLDGDTLSVQSINAVTGGTVVDNGDGTVTFTPDAGFTGTGTFSYTVTDGTDTATANVAVTVEADAPPPPTGGEVVSDDFNDATLASIWTVEGPTGVSSALGVSGDEYYLELVTSTGDHDVWDQNKGVRALQQVDDGDMQLEVRFLSQPTQRYEMQGILVEQDADNWIRFDTYSTGSKLKVFAGVTLNGDSTVAINATVPGNIAPYLRVERLGDVWTLSYSVDGAAWTVAGSFNLALNVTAVGPFAGSTTAAAGFTAQVDYFFNSAAPVSPEDGSVFVNTPPTAEDDAVAVLTDTATDIAVADLLSNDSDPDGSVSFVTFTQPTNGALVEVGGVLTYTPNAGYTGADSFTYTITDGELTDTATVNITVADAPGAVDSDDFSGATLGSMWTAQGPTGTSVTLGAFGGESYLELTTSTGDHDVWKTNKGASALQAIDNGDFEVQARFLSQPTERYEMQGILVEEDAANWIRFDTFATGSGLTAFAAVTINGSSSARISVAIPGATAPYLRVTRSGDDWTFSYSTDGLIWTVAGSFTQALNVTAVGPFAGSTESALGYTAQVDYFWNTDAPGASEDGTPVVNEAPVAGDDSYGTYIDQSVDLSVAELLSNDADALGRLQITDLSTPTNGTLVDNGGTLTYTPNAGFEGTDSFTYTVSDGEFTDTATVTIDVTPPPPPPAPTRSDDFETGVFENYWQVFEPEGSSAVLTAFGDEKYLSLSTGPGNYDIWGSNNSVRVLQGILDEDFEVEAKFLTQPTEQYEIQGILVQQDDNTWIRFDTYSDGTRLYAFAGVNSNGSPSTRINVQIPEGEAPYLRVTRVGDDWTLSYSTDGGTWVVAGTFTQAITVAHVGPFAASTAQASGYTAQVDYFFNTASPIDPEDGVIIVNTPPVAGDDAYAADTDTPLDIAEADLLSNDTDGQGDTLFITGYGDPQNGVLVDNGSTVTYTPNPGFTGVDSFTYTVSDGEYTGTGTVTVTVQDPPPPPGPVASDGFDETLLSNIWTIEGPDGVTSALGASGNDHFLALTTPDGDYDVWRDNNGARALQNIEDSDFEIEIKFLSTPTEDAELQGVLVEQDANHWLRFDTYTNGSTLYAFAAITIDGSSTAMISVPVPGGSAPYLRVNRSGDDWTLSYSVDGQNWVTAGSFTHAMTVAKVGPFAGSTSGSGGFTAEVDYFYNTAVPFAVDDQLIGSADQPLDIDVQQDLLANDFDLNNDPLTLVSFTQPENGTVTDTGGGVVTYQIVGGDPDGAFGVTTTGGLFVADASKIDPATTPYYNLTVRATNGVVTQDVTVDVTVVPPTGEARSDDFAGGALDPIWTYSGIVGEANVVSNGGEHYMEIVSPPGVIVTASDFLTTPRVLQSIDNGDFQISAGFLSEPAQTYSEHGLLIVEDDSNFIRFDIAHTSTSLKLLIGVTTNGNTQFVLNQAIPDGSVTDFRVTRTGDDWVFETSADGVTWTVVDTRTHVMAVNEVGVFAGSNEKSGTVPGYTAQVDYFESSTDPIVDEDNNGLNNTPSAGVINSPTPGDLSFTIESNAQNDDNVGVVTADEVPGPTLTYTPDQGFSGVDSFEYTITDGENEVTATANIAIDNVGPIAGDDTYSMDEDSTAIFSVADNDSDPNGDTLTVTTVSTAANGTVTKNSTGTITYTPNANFFGTDSFTYEITDGVETSTATVTVTVNGIEDPVVAQDDTLFTTPDSTLVLNIATDLLGNDIEVDGQTLDFVDFSSPLHGTLVDNGDGTLSYTPDAGYTGADTFSYTISDGNSTDTATVAMTVGDAIRVFYGNDKTFGQHGEAQVWANIMGNVVTTNLVSLSYSFNGGAYEVLALGPDGRRLLNDGDFNVDLLFTDLDGGPTDDVVTLRAEYSNGLIQTQDVTIDYESGNRWSYDYSIDWSTVSNIEDVSQVVDGEWYIGEFGVRPVDTGYDRLIGIGDQTWDNYEVLTEVTVHNIGVGGGAWGYVTFWNGHTDQPKPGYDPKVGWEPSGAFWSKTTNIYVNPYDGGGNIIQDTFPYQDEGTYNVRFRIEQVNGYDRLVSWKLWEKGTAEPTEWLQSIIDEMSEPVTGSFLLTAHLYDVSFGNIQVTEVIGSDIEEGTEGDDFMVLVDTQDALPGVGETDVFKGHGGQDVFVLGENGTVYYDDGDSQSAGEEDYGMIWDFETGVDTIRLAGEASDYYLAATTGDLEPGTGIYRADGELVGIVANTTGLTLTSEDFEYDMLLV